MARPKVEDTEQLNIRLATDAIGRADALIPHQTSRLGKTATRTDVLRAAVMLGLRQLELERAAESGGGRRRTGS